MPPGARQRSWLEPLATTYELGWSTVSHELLITTDTNLRYQQNLRVRFAKSFMRFRLRPSSQAGS
jgi:hypothetical protein